MDGISFSVERGEIFGLLGPNGAGKTTIEILESMREPDTGEVRELGLDVTQHSAEIKSRMEVKLQTCSWWIRVKKRTRF